MAETSTQLQKVERRELKKHAATIHSSNSLSLLQRKISNALLFHAYAELMTKEEHEISVKQLCKLIGYSGHNHAVIRDALKELLSTVIEWNVVSDKTGAEDWSASSILASVCLSGPLCYYAYSPRMKLLLHSPTMFGRIDLLIQSQFRSSYGLALYENCIRYRGLPYTKWLDMDTFRKLMGIPKDKYPIFRDFKKRVLDKSVEEVNCYSDLVVEAEVGREGKKATRIRFSLKERAKRTRIGLHQNVLPLLSEVQLDLRGKLVEAYGFSKDQAEHALREYPQAKIEEKMAIIENSKNYRQGRVHNLSAYLMSALRFDYQETKGRGKAAVKPKALAPEESDRAQKHLQEEIRAGYQQYRIEVIDATLKGLSKYKRGRFMKKFREYADLAIQTVLNLQASKYNRTSVLNSPQIQAILRQFIEQELLTPEVLTFDNFLENLAPEKKRAWKSIPEVAL